MEDTQITYIGKVDHRNKLTKFGIRAKDRTKHMYVIGKTGTGKTTFIENMIAQDIENGNGFAFIDPHGESTNKLLDYIPEWRVNDVIYLNPADVDFPVAFNPLEDVGPEKRHLVADGLMSVFEKIWPEAFSGRATYILNNTMLALLESPDSSMMAINRMLTDKEYRKRIVANVTDVAVKNVWDTDLMKWDDKRWSEAIGTLVNKVGQFTSNPIIRNIIGQTKSTFDFRRAMDERKIILINLSKGMIGEQNAPLIGAMLITKIYLAAMSRADLPYHVAQKVPPFYFYVDEFQNFANDSFANILSEARKYKLCLTVANQYIAQMEETIRDAVFGNMGTTVAFRVGPLDAEFIEKVFAPVFTQEDLQNVMFGQYYISLQIDGMGSKPFSAQGLMPIPPLQTSMRTMVIEASRKQFARPKIEVDAAVKEWFTGSRPTEPSGTKMVENRVIRGDVGNQPARKFDAKIFDTNKTITKPLPPITGFKKPDDHTPQQKQLYVAPLVKPVPSPVVPVSTVTPKPIVPPVPVPKKDSAELVDLLGKLDTVVVADNKDVSIKPVDTQTATIPKSAVSEFIPKAMPKPVEPKPLVRAATPEKKNALAEALARAMADKPKIDPVTAPVVTTQKTETVTAVIPEKEKIVDKQPESQIQKQEPVVTTIPEPDPVIQKNSYRRTQTVREVPEDILRQVLD